MRLKISMDDCLPKETVLSAPSLLDRLIHLLFRVNRGGKFHLIQLEKLSLVMALLQGGERGLARAHQLSGLKV